MPSRRFPPPWPVTYAQRSVAGDSGGAELLGAAAKRLARNGAIPPLRKPRRRPACDLFRGHLRTLDDGLEEMSRIDLHQRCAVPVAFVTKLSSTVMFEQ